MTIVEYRYIWSYDTHGSYVYWLLTEQCCYVVICICTNTFILTWYVGIWNSLGNFSLTYFALTHSGRNKIGATLQTVFSNGFSRMKIFVCPFKLHWRLVSGVLLTIWHQGSFSGAVSLGLDELTLDKAVTQINHVSRKTCSGRNMFIKVMLFSACC